MGGGQALRQAHIGAILIEFALVIPVLIAIVYYLHDIPKMKRMHAKMEFATHCMVNILQNVSQKRENKKITIQDIKFAMIQGFGLIYPGKTMFSTDVFTHIYGHYPMGFVVCVKGMAGGNASVLWRIITQASMDGNGAGLREGSHSNSTIKYFTNVPASQIYKGLEIKENEIKILVEFSIDYNTNNSNEYRFTDGRKCRNVSPREAFGFLVLKPRITANGYGLMYFTRVVIFTPNPGLFDEIPPEELTFP